MGSSVRQIWNSWARKLSLRPRERLCAGNTTGREMPMDYISVLGKERDAEWPEVEGKVKRTAL